MIYGTVDVATLRYEFDDGGYSLTYYPAPNPAVSPYTIYSPSPADPTPISLHPTRRHKRAFLQMYKLQIEHIHHAYTNLFSSTLYIP